MLDANIKTNKSEAMWYIVQVRGNLKPIAAAIQRKVVEMGLPEDTIKIEMPVKEGKRVSYGKVVKTETYKMPGYLLVNMKMTDSLKHMIESIQQVSRFLGEATEEEVMRVVSDTDDKGSNVVLIKYDVGEEVKIIDGPFASFTGAIQEIEEDKQKLKVTVPIFGRPTPVELEYYQVEKL